jgi:hypothetical protein
MNPFKIKNDLHMLAETYTLVSEITDSAGREIDEWEKFEKQMTKWEDDQNAFRPEELKQLAKAVRLYKFTLEKVSSAEVSIWIYNPVYKERNCIALVVRDNYALRNPNYSLYYKFNNNDGHGGHSKPKITKSLPELIDELDTLLSEITEHMLAFKGNRKAQNDFLRTIIFHDF